MYSVEFKEKNCLEYRILAVRRPSIPAPKKRYSEITIPGRDGVLIEYDDCYDPITIPVEFNFMNRPEEWGTVFRVAKRWLDGEGKLKFSDDQEFYYNCINCSIEDTERTTRKLGKFTANFLCDPYMYLRSGDEPIENPSKIMNYYEKSHPDYILTGSGGCTLTVNGKEMQATVNGTLTINTDRMIAYNQDGNLQNSMITGDYEDLYLIPGDNTISIEGADLKVIPHWRCR